MELHISSNDFDFITDIFEEAYERMEDVKGYCSLNGTTKEGEHYFGVNVEGKDFSKEMRTPVSFGQMLDMMKYVGPNTIYFKRDDWEGNHEAVFLDNLCGVHIISKCFLSDVCQGDGWVNVHTKLYTESIPYIPNYEDMFEHGWYVYKIKNHVVTQDDMYKEGDDFDDLEDFEELDNEDDEMVDFGGYSF
ncbi:hypothetical protein [Butyrivibrio sp. AE3009]|uniref:hypothetical protein n=1 Tax=Butyrivibrio sp. AE3009 TaxID=1280666 RepID=UPI0003B302C6|nr:hypothetical protein [Butyrivibrio sp. AE3009]